MYDVIRITFLAAWVIAGSAVWAAEFYVSPEGDDRNPGTEAAPFATIAQARDRVATRNGKMTDDITVYLRGGTYALSSSVVFDADDSGRNGHKVIYKAYAGETPIVSGGKWVEGWSLHDRERNIYKASVGPFAFRQIYVNDVRGIRARHPNLANEETLGNYLGGASVTGSKPHHLKVNAAELSDWDNLEDVEVVMVSHWKQKRARIASVSGAMIRFQSPENTARSMQHHEQGGTPHFYENAYEFLDAEGEFYLNTKSNTLFYKPRDGENMASVEVAVPTVETLFDIRGSSASNRVHDIRFEGITFQYSNWTKPNRVGYQVMQSATWLETDQRSPIPGAVQLQHASNIEIRACTVRGTGANGIVATRDVVSDCSFVGNRVSDTAAGGIYLLLNHEASTGNLITDNTLENIGMVYSDGCGILVARTPDVSILHNEIRRVRYTGISTGWTWNDKDSTAQNHDVGYNLIYGVMRLHDDGGGIYTLGKIPGMYIHGNYIHSSSRSKHAGHSAVAGIYLDNGSCLKHVVSNVIQNVDLTFYAKNPPNYNNVFKHNYHNGSIRAVSEKNEVKNNTLVKGLRWPEDAQRVMKRAGPRNTFRWPDPESWRYDAERAAGMFGGALACTGSVFAEVPHSPELEPECLTLEAWVRMDALPDGRDHRRWIAGKNANELAEGHYALAINGDSAGAFLNIGGGLEGLHQAWSARGALTLGQWHYLALTYDGKMMTFFLDGQAVATNAVNRTRNTGIDGFAIGRRQDGFTYFKGRIDEVRLYDRALNAAEVKQHYEHPAPVVDVASEKGLVRYWPF